MSTQRKAEFTEEVLSEDAIHEYLAGHPDFSERHAPYGWVLPIEEVRNNVQLEAGNGRVYVVAAAFAGHEEMVDYRLFVAVDGQAQRGTAAGDEITVLDNR